VRTPTSERVWIALRTLTSGWGSLPHRGTRHRRGGLPHAYR
jgi:hypothetical protein